MRNAKQMVEEGSYMKSDICTEIMKSWDMTEGNVNSQKNILSWIKSIVSETFVSIKPCYLSDSDYWYYDKDAGIVENRNKSFFQIRGVRQYDNGMMISEGPIINQPEIGFLGIICRRINGVLNFLIQAKIEPGNVNCVQLSPTIQATKSNFTKQHGGKLPNYLSYFENSSQYEIIADCLESEQSGRFFRKRNRNIICIIDEDIEVLPNFMWMTLGQLKQLMRIKNLVNMDTRTVVSCLPLHCDLADQEKNIIKNYIYDEPLYNSIYDHVEESEYIAIISYMNKYRMLTNRITNFVPLFALKDWRVSNEGISCINPVDYCVRYYSIDIEGREVKHWIQPMLMATTSATFGLITFIEDRKRKFIVRLRSEVGALDVIEIGPTVLAFEFDQELSESESFYYEQISKSRSFMADVILSEEGGRFYHEQNRNVIMEMQPEEARSHMDEFCYAVTFKTLNRLICYGNSVNIQLRNLLSLIDYEHLKGNFQK